MHRHVVEVHMADPSETNENTDGLAAVLKEVKERNKTKPKRALPTDRIAFTNSGYCRKRGESISMKGVNSNEEKSLSLRAHAHRRERP